MVFNLMFLIILQSICNGSYFGITDERIKYFKNNRKLICVNRK